MIIQQFLCRYSVLFIAATDHKAHFMKGMQFLRGMNS